MEMGRHKKQATREGKTVSLASPMPFPRKFLPLSVQVIHSYVAIERMPPKWKPLASNCVPFSVLFVLITCQALQHPRDFPDHLLDNY